MSLTLKGMTWSHERGIAPMRATSRIWKEKTGVEIEWDARSLADFESFPVEELARGYDLMVIDHPHIGAVSEAECLAPLDIAGREAERNALSENSVGLSYSSYALGGRQWAFPIDAAAQVMAYRPDLVETPPERWSDVLELAREGRVALPLKPPHSLMVFFTLCANSDRPANLAGAELVDRARGREILAMMAEIAGLIDPANFSWDPIDASEAMARADSPLAVMPLVYGYANYARDGFRESRLAFADIPIAGHNEHAGSALGGTGIAVSAFSDNIAAATEYAYWVASGDVQRGAYAEADGQPGHARAWEDDEVNAPVHDFYRNTRATLEGAWLRPRHNGYMGFQQAAGERLVQGLRAGENADDVLDDLDRLFAESQ